MPFPEVVKSFTPPHTCNIYIIFLSWGNNYNRYFGSTFPKVLCFRVTRAYRRHTYCWLEDSASWPETVNHQQYPDGLWLGLVTIAYTWGISRFCSWFIQLWLSWLKRKNLTNIKLVYITEHFTHSFAPIDPEILRSLLHGVVLMWHYEAGSLSFPLLLCTSTGLQEPFIRFVLSFFKAIYHCNGGGLNFSFRLQFCLYPCLNNDSNANCHSPFIPKAADFLQPDTRFASSNATAVVYMSDKECSRASLWQDKHVRLLLTLQR